MVHQVGEIQPETWEVQPKALLVWEVQPKSLLVREVHPKACLVVEVLPKAWLVVEVLPMVGEVRLVGWDDQLLGKVTLNSGGNNITAPTLDIHTYSLPASQAYNNFDDDDDIY